jgi:hypothetical protein
MSVKGRRSYQNTSRSGLYINVISFLADDILVAFTEENLQGDNCKLHNIRNN